MTQHNTTQPNPLSDDHEQQHQQLRAQIADLEQRLIRVETDDTEKNVKSLATNFVIVNYLPLFASAQLIYHMLGNYTFAQTSLALPLSRLYVIFLVLVFIHAPFIKMIYTWARRQTPTQLRVAMGILGLVSVLMTFVGLNLVRPY